MPRETPKERIRVEAELKKAAAAGDTTQVSIALQMVLQFEHVEYLK
jgi:hypothetical protein